MLLKNISVDCVILGFKENKLHVLLWQAEPELLEKFLSTEEEYNAVKELFENNPALRSDKYWGLIGSHLPSEEDLDEYAKKLLSTATGIDDIYLKQVKTFGSPSRVPYYRVLTVAYYALINPDYHDLKLSPIAKAVKWFDIDHLPQVIFDTREIIEMSLNMLRKEVHSYPVGFHLLPDKFTLTQLQILYEVILNKKLDTRNFRKKIQNMGLLIDTHEKQINVRHRAAKLFSFNTDTYKNLIEEGLYFRI
jgi:8-oxo-dGTP diphosphatase